MLRRNPIAEADAGETAKLRRLGASPIAQI